MSDRMFFGGSQKTNKRLLQDFWPDVSGDVNDGFDNPPHTVTEDSWIYKRLDDSLKRNAEYE